MTIGIHTICTRTPTDTITFESLIEARIVSGQAPSFHAQWTHGEGKEEAEEATCTANESRCTVRAG
jgi:hypothetical protein